MAERDGAATRVQLIDATIETILDEGFYRASSNRIAERAGVTWGVIQYHFGTREALLIATFEHGMRELLETLESAAIEGETFSERLDGFVDVLWAFYRQPRFVAYEELTLNLTRDPTIDDETVAMVTGYDAQIGRRLRALADAVLGDRASAIPPLALVHIVRGVAIGLTLAEARGARPRRSGGTPPKETRRVIVAALEALAADAPRR